MNALVHEDLSALFAVPAEDWTTIDYRAGTALAVQWSIAHQQQFLYSEPPQTGPIRSFHVTAPFLVTPPAMPTLPPLAAAAQQWIGTTRPSIASAATEVATVSGLIVDLLSELKKDVDGGHSPTAEPFQKIQDFAADQAQRFSALIPPMLAFRDSNNETETWAANYTENGHGNIVVNLFRSNVSALSVWNAVSAVQGAWSALRDDLGSVGPGTFDPILWSLEIAAAITAWQQIGAEAAAFAGSTVRRNAEVSV
jgi:hypothetical protein